MSGPAKGVWGFPPRCQHPHFFPEGKTSSACEKFPLEGATDKDPDEPKHDSDHDCPACARIVKTLREEEAKKAAEAAPDGS